MDDHYDVPQICLNGHVANEATRAFPADCRKFCEQCGEPTTTRCEACRSDIRGPFVSAHGTMLAANPHTTDPWRVPQFCEHCGKVFPWTERALAAAREIVAEERALTVEDKEAFNIDVNDVVRDVPRTRAAAIGISKMLAKLPGAVGSALRDTLVDVASEAAKKIILGP